MPIDARDLTPETEALRQRAFAALDYEAPDDPHDGPPWRRPWAEPVFDRPTFTAEILRTINVISEEDERTRVYPLTGYSVATYKRLLTMPPTLDQLGLCASCGQPAGRFGLCDICDETLDP